MLLQVCFGSRVKVQIILKGRPGVQQSAVFLAMQYLTHLLPHQERASAGNAWNHPVDVALHIALLFAFQALLVFTRHGLLTYIEPR